MSEGDSVSSGFSQAFVDNIVKVSDIPSTTTQEALVIYFQSEASSGGGEVVQNGCVRLNDNQALVVFTEKRSKQRVLSRDHVLNDTQLKVTPFPDTGEEVPHAQGGSGSHHGYGLWDSPLLGSFQMCQPHFENPWSKGTPTDGVNYSYGNGHSYHQVMNTNDVVNYPPMADVSSIWTDTPSKVENFIPAESADGALAEQETSHGYLSINEIENVTPPPGFGEKCKPHERRLLEVTGFKDGTTTEMIELFFENKKKSGGGDIKDFQFDVDKNKAFIQFDDPKDLDSVLNKTELVLGGTRIKVKVYAPKPKTAVSVTGMREGTTMETLELYFENPKRSKGDDVKTIRMNEARTVAVIDYGSVEVAERVAAKKDHVLSNASLTVIQCSPDDESEAEEMSSEEEDSSSDGDYQQTEQLPMTAIRVTNFNPETPDETLVLFFESPKRCGGGEILRIRVNEERTVAVIDYGSVEVAERVATTSELIVDRSLVAVNACCPDVSVEPISSEAGLAVDVSGFKPSSPEEMIKHFFENKKKSRGGPILSMKLLEDVDPRTYRIVFQKSDDAVRVLKKKNLRLDSAELIVAVASDAGRSQAHTCATSVMQSEHPDQAQPVTTIRISGLPKDTSHDLLENFFENRRKSAGGKVNKVELDEVNQTALVTFADPSAADRVYQNRFSLKLNKTPIDVELVQPPKPKKKLPLDPYKLVVSNIPEDTSSELLLNYMENRTRCDVSAIRYGEKPGLGIVIFEQVPDVPTLRQACTQKPLQKSVLQIEPVYLTDSIQVHNLPPNCTEDTLENYFENKKKSGGGEVEKVIILRNGKVAVTTFADHTVVQRVIEKKHEVNKCILKVCEYYEQFGFRHPDDDTSKPVARIPDDAVVGPFDVCIVKFVDSSLECRQLLDNDLKRHHGQVNWEASTSDSLAVTCFLSSSEQLAEMTIAWENVVTEAARNFFANYSTEIIDVLQDIWTDLLERLAAHVNEKLLIETSDERNSIRLTGVKSIVDEVLNKVNEDKKALEEEFNRKSQEVTETVTTLKDYELLFLQEMKFDVSGCKCEIDVKKKHIQFIGIPLDVNKAKSDMYEILRNLTSEKVGSTPALLLVLKTPECTEYIYSQFRTSNVAASWTTTGNDINVFASDKNVSKKAAQIMSRELSEAVVPVQAESKPLLTGSQWQSVKESQLMQYRGCLEIVEDSDLTQLTIAGTRSVTANVREVVQDFFESNTIYERKVRLSSGKFRFMEQYNDTGIMQIQESLKTHYVGIRFQADSTSIVIKGTNTGVELSFRKISDLMGKVLCKNIEVAEPGMDEFFNCQRGKSFLETVERKNKCIIVIGEDDVCDEESQGAMQQHKDTADVMCQVNKYGKTFKVIQGDMTKHKVDVIVNAANGELKNVGGLALAIVKQGGNCIQEECNGIIEQRGTVLPGKTATTGSGNLPCKKVVHVVGPQWSGGNRNETNYLFQGVINALKATEKGSYKSLAIPAVGAGIFGVPLKVSTLTIVEAVVDYFTNNQQSVIREVHFLDNQMGTVQEFAKAVKLKIGLPSSTSFAGATMLPKVVSRPPMPSPVGQTKPNTITTRSGVVIKMVKGQLAHQMADVIVNTVGAHLDLSQGAVSNSLFQKAGIQLQQECSSRYPNGINYGEVLETQGYNLPCTCVYYIVAKPFGKSDTEKCFRSMIRNCLKKAEATGFGSIAFPAIGTGILGYKRDFVARVMFEEFTKFSDQSPRHLKDLRVVVYDKDLPTCQAFEAEIGRRAGSGGSIGSKRHGVSSQTSQIAAASSVTIGGISVRVFQGDITKQATDAIVNPSNSDLNLSMGQVSAAIVSAGGDAIVEECRRKAAVFKILLVFITAASDTRGMPNHGCVMTGAGNLSCHHIVHVDVQSLSVTSVLQNALIEANNAGVTSLSIPAIGTAMTQDKVEENAKHLFKAVSKVSKKLNQLRSINIVVFHQQMVSVYENVMHTQLGQPGKNFFQRAWSKLVGSDDVDDEDVQHHTSHFLGINLRIFGSKDSDITKAIEEIKQLCKDELCDVVMDGSLNKEYAAIRLLTKEEIASISALNVKHRVSIEVDLNDRIHRIRIRGRTECVLKAKDEIRQVLHSAEQRKTMAEQAELLAKHVQWTFEENNGWTPYSNMSNLKIEQAYSKKESKIKFSENRVQCEIDFRQMTEQTPGQVPAPVKRVEIGAGNIENPPTWDSMTGPLKIVDLQPKSPEYAKVEADFVRMQPSTVKKIQRIQNPRLWKTYAIHKEYMESVNSKARKIERTLYHGTSVDTLDKINRQGFNRSFAGKNATALGAGVYFAVDASYSARGNYATPNPATGEQHIYQCKVLTGEYTQGNHSMVTPPARNVSGSVLYDTTCDNVNNPSIFVTFHDNQAYPEYLITFQ